MARVGKGFFFRRRSGHCSRKAYNRGTLGIICDLDIIWTNYLKGNPSTIALKVLAETLNH